uniref:Uncharacterized protein n=1 Tax=Cacopsylla melanoneura TaxID=428564 RepID=A0A8D8ZCZ1_9HEMI
MQTQFPEDDIHSPSSSITVLSLPFSDISCYKVGSINKAYNETHFSSAYQNVLEILLKNQQEEKTTMKPKNSGKKTLSELFEEIGEFSIGEDDEKKEVETDIIESRQDDGKREVKGDLKDSVRSSFSKGHQTSMDPSEKSTSPRIGRRKVGKEKSEDKLTPRSRSRPESTEPGIDEPDRMLWGPSMTALDYSEFFVTPPNYNQYATHTPHWADRVKVGVTTREKSREKVSDWLARQCHAGD